ncbi:hypothetical protein RJ639_033204 [Escallonia herrerae]|uniref:Non-haem dioxygenase N-terminal domain-containing protein n=1 Tax=Escallonia herrerae TaxID=1293975 RepID=A0AA89BGD9_9ASTE|nr:hypothetical protein RJ639_033204 [Escallonia herrerae]
MTSAASQGYNRLRDIKQFDDQKIGVKGLVDSGITSIPRFFHHPPETRPAPTPTSRPDLTIPTVDLSAPRAAVIRQIHHASSTLGFFQIINHNIPQSLLHSLIASIKSFNEQPAELKSPYYHRDPSRGGAAFSTNFDLYQSKAASWRDTLYMRLAPTPPNWDFVPNVCREAVAEWDTAVVSDGDERPPASARMGVDVSLTLPASKLVMIRLRNLGFAHIAKAARQHQSTETIGVSSSKLSSSPAFLFFGLFVSAVSSTMLLSQLRSSPSRKSGSRLSP